MAARPASPAGSDVSTTSTVEYDHLPFADLTRLLPSLLSTLPLPAPLTTTRLPGGSYHRLVALTFPPPHPASLLRITRNTEDPPPLAPTIALLPHLSPIPVPRVIAYDTTTSNPLQLPYLIQSILPGQRLDEVYDSLSTDQKCHVARQYARLLAAVESHTFATPGLVVPAAALPDRGVLPESPAPVPLAVDRFPEPRNPYVEPASLPPRKPAQRSTVALGLRSLLLERLQANIDADAADSARAWLVPNWEVVRQLILALDVSDEPPAEGYVLHHWDLEARNILVDPATGDFKGVLDWDQAQAIPRVLGRRAPVWLWDNGEGWEEGVREEWDGDADEVEEREPKKGENKRVYEAFLAEVMEGLKGNWREDAEGEGRWVRRCWRVVSEGLWTSAELGRLERLLEDWNDRNGNVDTEMEG